MNASCANNIIVDLEGVGIVYRTRGRWFTPSPKGYWALEDVSFTIQTGETFGIIGKNGAGKSTLLKLIAGIIAPDRGLISSNFEAASLLSLQVGFLPHLTGRENAILSGLLLGLTKAEVLERMPEIVDFAELHEFIDSPLSTYSAGMRARLGFSIGYRAGADLILIDEILGVGDIDFYRKSRQAIENILRSKKTVIVVSHNLATLGQLCDRIAWIEHGRTMKVDETDKVIDLYTKYHSATK